MSRGDLGSEVQLAFIQMNPCSVFLMVVASVIVVVSQYGLQMNIADKDEIQIVTKPVNQSI